MLKFLEGYKTYILGIIVLCLALFLIYNHPILCVLVAGSFGTLFALMAMTIKNHLDRIEDLIKKLKG